LRDFHPRLRTSSPSAPAFQLFASNPGVGIEFGYREKLVAGLFDRVFYQPPVEQRALGLLPAGGDLEQAPEPGWVVVVSQVRRGYNSTMKFRVLLEYDAQAGRWSAVFPDLPGCASAGDTEEEAVANAKEALALWFDSTPVDIPKNGKLLEVALP